LAHVLIGEPVPTSPEHAPEAQQMRHAIARKRPPVRTMLIILTNTFLAFVIFNVLVWCGYALYDSVLEPLSNVQSANEIKLESYYPGLTKTQIGNLLEESYQFFEYEPFVEFRERARTGNYVNVDQAGFRLSGAQSKWPPDPGQPVIFVFGGSTTFGYSVPDDETVVSTLSTALRRDPRYRGAQLYNFGRGHYWSTQEYVLLSTMMHAAVKPSMAIFIDGLNEFYYSRQRPIFADEMRNAFERIALARTTRGRFSVIWQDTKQLASSLPMFRLASAVKRARSTPQQAPRFQPYNPEGVRSSIANYFINKAMIERIAELDHIETLFVWQPIPSYKYPSHLHTEFETSGYGPHSQSFYGYPQMRELIESRKDDNLIWCADVQKEAVSRLYVDLVHYNRHGAELVADCIAGAILARPMSPRAIR
jgi:hypothetical protein